MGRGADDRLDLAMLLDAPDGRWAVKVSRPHEDPTVVDLQTRAMVYASAHAPADVRLSRVRSDRAGRRQSEPDVGAGPHPRVLRAIEYLPDAPIGDPTDPRGVLTSARLARIGTVCAEVADSLKGFTHPAEERPIVWDLQRLSVAAGLLELVADAALARQIERSVAEFERFALPRPATLSRQVLHDDLTRFNVLANPTDPGVVTGVIDFGDTVRTARALDLAVAVGSMLDGDGRGWELAGPMIASRSLVHPLTDDELAVVAVAAPGRLALRALMQAHAASVSPERGRYLASHAPALAATLRRVLDIPVAARADDLRHARDTAVACG